MFSLKQKQGEKIAFRQSATDRQEHTAQEHESTFAKNTSELFCLKVDKKTQDEKSGFHRPTASRSMSRRSLFATIAGTIRSEGEKNKHT
eukprot:2877911-Rhodomonas_salina.1